MLFIFQAIHSIMCSNCSECFRMISLSITRHSIPC
jgi:hypothetical protein